MPQWILYGKKSEKNRGAVSFLISAAINCDFVILCDHFSRFLKKEKGANCWIPSICLTYFPFTPPGNRTLVSKIHFVTRNSRHILNQMTILINSFGVNVIQNMFRWHLLCMKDWLKNMKHRFCWDFVTPKPGSDL